MQIDLIRSISDSKALYSVVIEKKKFSDFDFNIPHTKRKFSLLIIQLVKS